MLPSSHRTRLPHPMLLATLCVGTLAACGVSYDASFEEMAMLTWPTDGVEDLVVETGVPGDVSVTAGLMRRIDGALHRGCLGQTELEASVYVERVQVVDDLQDGTLTLATSGAGVEERSPTANLDLFVPSDLGLTLDVGDGDAAVRDFAAGAVVEVMASSIEFERMGATILAVATDRIDANLGMSVPMQLVDLTAGGAVTIRLPADSVFLFDVRAGGEVVLEGFENLDLVVDQPDNKTGTVGNGDGAKIIVTAGADVTIVAE